MAGREIPLRGRLARESPAPPPSGSAPIDWIDTLGALRGLNLALSATARALHVRRSANGCGIRGHGRATS